MGEGEVDCDKNSVDFISADGSYIIASCDLLFDHLRPSTNSFSPGSIGLLKFTRGQRFGNPPKVEKNPLKRKVVAKRNCEN